MSKLDWVSGLPAEVTVSDAGGVLLAMNDRAEALFASDGGRGLIGSNMLDCHPEPSRSKLVAMLADHSTNAYISVGNGKKQFVFQAPWQQDGRYAGFVEISFDVPDEIAHFVRK
jgi:hypothetical protein